MKRFFLIGIWIFLFPFLVVDASSIDSIDIGIYVDNYGDATVTETWDAYVDEGTEGWHPYYNLGNSKISDLNVSMDGEYFTTISNWRVDSSLSDKAYQAGIYYPSNNEVDICFGITSYGKHQYVIQYKISNFVSKVDDADMIYWNLFPSNFSVEPGNITIQIYSDFSYSNSLDVWGYGKYGAPCYVDSGKIWMASNGRLSSDEYLTILVKFEKDTFQTSNRLSHDFSYYYNMAEEEAVHYAKEIHSIDLGDFFVVFFVFLAFAFPVFLVRFLASFFESDKFNLGDGGAGRHKFNKDVPVFREIPCECDIYLSYWLACKYSLIDRKDNLLGAILLKWIYDGYIKIENVSQSGLFGKRDVNDIVFLKRPTNEVEFEAKLYDFMYSASLDGRLEDGDKFRSWCRENYAKILSWPDDAWFFEAMILLKQGKITYKKDKKMSVLNSCSYEFCSELEGEVDKLAGLKRFLEEFSLIKEKEAIEVKLWKEYLIYAQMFGIADKVSEQFGRLYPEIAYEMASIGYHYRDILFIDFIVDSSVWIATQARNESSHIHSGGVGESSGSSSSGGGGGSFGSGDGGGGFR